ncbi:4'-phosphopantetheinyl transferase superfamily protein [Undibacterium aquatile]|uniref:4'-phosphopantetheinyl transferase superfamily protein n=1 Tax=Undibacterium aquatile TaxID=1537398 RepID=A0ABR6XE12_9BURK|nr:4'-phosphopantetheinyl transferase superfamily protein [Undibacterium aquatile]MBC3811017.1 4'-phosphopantetheinyl transferase superfamily protein [Undibacterium aquatile]
MQGLSLPAFAVFDWEEQCLSALDYFSQQSNVVISLSFSQNLQREVARQQLHLAITELLMQAFSCTAEQIRLIRIAGSRLQCIIATQEIFISVSHEPGLSVAAISQKQLPGIDLMAIKPIDDWQNVAGIYFSSQQIAALQQAQDDECAALFAQCWTMMEARFKCAGIAMTEYDEHVQQQMASVLKDCCSYALTLPAGYIGTLILRP